MSTKQTELSGNGHADVAGMAEQAMLATVGLANQGVNLLREAAQGAVTVADAVVDGTLDVASAWGKNTPMEPFTAAPVGYGPQDVGRHARHREPPPRRRLARRRPSLNEA